MRITDSKYYVNSFLHSIGRSIPNSVPFLPITIHLIDIARFFFPALTQPEFDLDDPDTYLRIDGPGSAELGALFYLKHCCQLPSQFRNQQDESKITNIVQEYLSSNYSFISSLNKKFNTNVAYTIKLSDPETINPFHYSCVGGHLSISPPLILDVLPSIKILSAQDLENFSNNFSPLSVNARNFVLGHEFAHILNNDNPKSLLYKIATTACSTIPWIVNYNDSSSCLSVTYYMLSIFQTLAIQSVADFAFSFYSRQAEKRADLESVQINMGDNTGALEATKWALFELQNLQAEEGFDHPTIEERLDYLKKNNQFL